MNPQPLEATGGSEAGFEWNPYFNSYEKGQREETAAALVETSAARIFERHRQSYCLAGVVNNHPLVW